MDDFAPTQPTPQPSTHAGPLVRSVHRRVDGAGIVIGVIAGLAVWAALALLFAYLEAAP